MESTSKIYNSQEVVSYEVNIDFDEASKSWKQNKKSIGNGQYKYICQKDGTKCSKVCYKDMTVCWIHRKNNK
jgi:hypothetical protein